MSKLRHFVLLLCPLIHLFSIKDSFNQLFEQLTAIKEKKSKTQIYNNGQIRPVGLSTTLCFKATLENKKEFNHNILLILECSKQTAKNTSFRMFL